MTDIVSRFRVWSGHEQFAKFVQALQEAESADRRLRHWQEVHWGGFRTDSGLELPQDYEGVRGILADVVGVASGVTVVIPQTEDRQAVSDAVRRALLAWAARRSEVHLDLAADLRLVADVRRHQAVAAIVQQLFASDAELRRTFAGGVVSVRIRAPGGGSTASGFTLAVDASDPEGDLGVGWHVGAASAKRPWWRFW
jgi:hypothetical protein